MNHDVSPWRVLGSKLLYEVESLFVKIDIRILVLFKSRIVQFMCIYYRNDSFVIHNDGTLIDAEDIEYYSYFKNIDESIINADPVEDIVLTKTVS